MVAKIIAVDKNDIIYENVKNKKRKLMSKHNFYPNDLPNVVVGAEIKIIKEQVFNEYGHKLSFLKVSVCT